MQTAMLEPDFQWKKENENQSELPQEHTPFDFDLFLSDTPWADEALPQESEDPEEDVPEAGPVQPETKLERLVAPPRPEILVAEPRRRVVIEPEMEQGDDEQEYCGAQRPSGRGGSLVWALVAAAVILILALVIFSSGGSGDTEPTETQTQAVVTMQPVQTSAPHETETTPEPTSAVKTYTVTVTAGSGGSIQPGGLVSVQEGDSVSFSVIPDSGYYTSQLLVDGESVQPGDVTLSNVQADHSVYAVFSPVPEETPEPTPVPTPEPTVEPTAQPEPEVTAEPEPETPTQTDTIETETN